MTGSVLVVDDDVLVRDVVGRYLGRAGYQVTLVGDGEDALRAAAVDPPDLVVLDLMLPGLPGLEVSSPRMRSSSSPRAVSMTTGTELAARSRRQTSRPDRPEIGRAHV